MRHVSLFTGIGGIDLGAEWAGFKTVLQVERDPYCLRVLRRHWPRVRRAHDVRDWRDIRRRVWREFPITVVSGGFPCQPFSAAGKRRGEKDDRYLWPAMLGVVRALVPTWVVAENVPGLLSLDGGMVFERVLSDLEGEGYRIIPAIVPAAGVGAPHLRNRVLIVARHATPDSERDSIRIERERRGEQQEQSDKATAVAAGNGEDVADTEEPAERPGLRQDDPRGKWGRRSTDGRSAGDWWATEPDVGRVAHGIPHRVDRLRGLGNGVVPQLAYQLFAAIRQFEEVTT